MSGRASAWRSLPPAFWFAVGISAGTTILLSAPIIADALSSWLSAPA